MSDLRLQRVPDIMGDDAEDTALLDNGRSAARYITSFAWCPPIGSMYLAYGVGGIVAVFLCDFAQKIANSDKQLWVVVGDLPSAYLVVEPGDGPTEVLESYCDLMQQWVFAVRSSGDLSKVFPVGAGPTPEHAEMLEQRIATLRELIIRETRK